MLTTPVLICDRDHVIARCGAFPRRKCWNGGSSGSGGDHGVPSVYILENPQSSPVYAVEGYDRPAAAVYPILAAGDVCGAVILSAGEDRRQPSEADRKLIAAAAMFLGRQMEE